MLSRSYIGVAMETLNVTGRGSVLVVTLQEQGDPRGRHTVIIKCQMPSCLYPFGVFRSPRVARGILICELINL